MVVCARRRSRVVGRSSPRWGTSARSSSATRRPLCKRSGNPHPARHMFVQTHLRSHGRAGKVMRRPERQAIASARRPRSTGAERSSRCARTTPPQGLLRRHRPRRSQSPGGAWTSRVAKTDSCTRSTMSSSRLRSGRDSGGSRPCVGVSSSRRRWQNHPDRRARSVRQPILNDRAICGVVLTAPSTDDLRTGRVAATRVRTTGPGELSRVVRVSRNWHLSRGRRTPYAPCRWRVPRASTAKASRRCPKRGTARHHPST